MKKIGGVPLSFPQEPHLLKRECHRLMQQIWGGDNKAAYRWLHDRFGTFQFSTLHDRDKLKEIYKALWFEDAKQDI